MDLESLTAGQTIPTRFLDSVAKHADVTALRMRREDGTYRQWSYRQYAEQVARCAAGLKALGLKPGERLVIMLRNRPEFHVLDMAAYFCGATAVSIYNSSSSEQIEYLVNHCEAAIAVADDRAFLQRFLDIRHKLPSLRHIGVLGADAPEGVFRWDALVEHAPLDLAQAARAAKPEDLATLIYTSGTTGPSKAVTLSHKNVVSAVASMEILNQEHPTLANPAGLRVVSYLPMAHIAERNTSHYLASLLGYEVTCCPEATQLAMYLREVRPQIVFGVPRVWEKLHAGVQAAVSGDPERAQKLKEAVDAAIPLVEKIHNGTATEQEKGVYQFLDDVAFKNLRALIGLDQAVLAVTGAAPMARELQLWFRAIGVPISDVYGMSENCGAMTWTPLAAKPGTVGKAIPGLEVKLGPDGEILCRGPMVTRGYLNAPDKTAEAIDDEGWLHSGDIGQVDEDGYFRVVDRKKELIITAGGKNISPANLEASLKSIPLIGQACAIGDDKPFVSALLVLDPDAAKAWAGKRGITAASLAELAKHPDLVAEVESHLPKVMASFNGAEKVKRVRILGVDWLPDSEELTPTSKLKRRVIHTKYKSEIEELYSTTLAPPASGQGQSQSGKRAAG